MLGSFLGFLPVVALMFRGQQWRERLGSPKKGAVFNDERIGEDEKVGDEMDHKV